MDPKHSKWVVQKLEATGANKSNSKMKIVAPGATLKVMGLEQSLSFTLMHFLQFMEEMGTAEDI